MVKNIKILVILLFICIITSINIYADNAKVWNGYSLYNLSDTAIDISNEVRSCTIFGSRISSVTSYTIKNSSTSEVTAVLGLPVNVIDGITVSENGKNFKLRIKSLQNIRNTYNIDGQLPQSDEWYYFSLILKGGESRTIQVKTEELLQLDSDGVYNLAFFKDSSNTRAVSGRNIQFKAEFTDYKPYNIVDVDGLQDNDINSSGVISFNMKDDAVTGFTIKYQPVEKMVLDKLSQSVYKKPKAIARAYRSRDYQTAMTLCDEYISFPQDKKLNTDQVKFVKAECLRQQKKYIEYVDMVNSINTATLYPSRVKYKILFDKLNFYKSENKNAEYKQLLTQIDNDTKENYEFLNSWLKINNYIVAADSNATTTESTAAPTKKKDNAKKAGFLNVFAGKLVKLVGSIRIDVAIGVIISFILGYLLGRRGGGRGGRRGGRSKGATYLFRN